MGPPVWAIARRFAPVMISSVGSGPFLFVAFPSIVLDEFLLWMLDKVQGKWGNDLSGGFILLLNLLHFLPVFARVLFLGLFSYADYEVPGVPAFVLMVCAFVWTGHNVYTMEPLLCNDLPEAVQKL